MSTLTVSTDLRTVECGSCGGVYAVSKRYYQQCYEQGLSWNCPYCQRGCGWAGGQGENKRLKRELENANRGRASLQGQLARTEDLRDHHRRSASAYKGQLTKAKKRAANGVCPCCSRTFSDLARHMKSKHPDFGAPVEEQA